MSDSLRDEPVRSTNPFDANYYPPNESDLFAAAPSSKYSQRSIIEIDVHHGDSLLTDLSRFIIENETNYSHIPTHLSIHNLESDPLHYSSFSETNDSIYEDIVARKNISFKRSSHDLKDVTKRIDVLEGGFDIGGWESSPNRTKSVLGDVSREAINRIDDGVEARMQRMFKEYTAETDKRIAMNELLASHRITTIEKDVAGLAGDVRNMRVKLAQLTISKSDGIEHIRSESVIGDIKFELDTLKASIVEVGVRASIVAQAPMATDTVKVDSEFSAKMRQHTEQIMTLSQFKADHMKRLTEHSSDITKLTQQLGTKVDSITIEELMRHIATREELQSLANIVQKQSRNSSHSSIELQQSNKKSESLVSLNAKKKLDERLKTVRSDTDARFKSMELWMRGEVKALKLNAAESIANASPVIDKDKSEVRIMTSTEMDDKFAVLCGELSQCKLAWQQAIRQPFYRAAQWIWKSGVLKVNSSAIPWNVETTNTDSDNLTFEADSPIIKIEQGGLYEISFAIFTKTKPSIQIVVNGESVMSAINSPSYVVHHSSGYMLSGNGCLEPGTVSGLSLVDYLALPYHSTISLCYYGGKKGLLGHGFLSLRKL